jgi:hypothetical protein
MKYADEEWLNENRGHRHMTGMLGAEVVAEVQPSVIY